MLGIAENLRHRSHLHSLAAAHHAHPIRHLAHNAQIVSDEQNRHAESRLQLLEQFKNLRLNGDIQSRGRLIGDQDVGIVGQSHGDHHPLALTAG